MNIDEDLSWGPHIDATKRKLYYAKSTLSRIKETVPEFLQRTYTIPYLSHTIWNALRAKLSISDNSVNLADVNEK